MTFYNLNSYDADPSEDKIWKSFFSFLRENLEELCHMSLDAMKAISLPKSIKASRYRYFDNVYDCDVINSIVRTSGMKLITTMVSRD